MRKAGENIGLSEIILKLIEERGFKTLTEPQKKAIPYILAKRNTLIIAPTGSGKTEAAFIPVLQMMINEPGEPIETVYITPLRALNRDLIDRLMWWANKLDLKISVRHGDTPKKERRIQSESPPHILITTPETFSFLLNTKVIGNYLRNVRWIIVDEVHELIGSKRGVQLSIALERVREYNKDIQVIGLSATVGEPSKILDFITGGREGVIVTSDITKKIAITMEYPEPSENDYKIAEKLLTYPDVVARLRLINEYLKKVKSTLIFTNTRCTAEILGNRLMLYNDKIPVMVHHGSLGSTIRTRIERMLKEGRLKGIICTSSLELGIDVGDIELVIQYGSPRQASKLLQRVGRSGHWIGKVSNGVIISLDPDDAIESLVVMKRALEGRLESIDILKNPLDVLAHEIVGLLIKHKKITLDTLVKIIGRSIFYKELNFEEFIKLLEYHSEVVKTFIYDKERKILLRSRFKDRMYKYYFDNLSMIPETIQYYVIDDESNSLIGVLDEKFVSLYGETGVKFIMGGKVWRIVQIFKDKIYVKEAQDAFGAVPEWVGEEIPVPYEVAREVGSLKRKFLSLIKREGYEEAIEKLASEYRIDKEMFKRVMKTYYETYKENSFIPTDRDIVIERIGNKLVINIHGGTLVNRTVGSYLAYSLYIDFGERVKYSTNQYRIFIEGYTLEDSNIIDLLSDPSKLKSRFKEIVCSSNVFRWRFVHVGRRMGVIEKSKRMNLREVSELIKILKDTPVYLETFKETSSKDFDLSNSIDLLEKIRDKKLKIKVYDGVLRLTKNYLDRMKPKYELFNRNKKEILEIASYKAKIMNKYVVLACLECMNYIEEVKIGELNEEIRCPLCGSNRIGFSENSIEEVIRLIDLYRHKKDKIRNIKLSRIIKSSEIISKYGKAGLFVLAFDYITFKDAKEILSRENTLNDKLVKLTLEKSRENLSKMILRGKKEVA